MKSVLKKRLVSRLLFAFFDLISRLSWKNAFLLSDFLFWLVFHVVGYRKRVVYENLRKSFPEKKEAELDCIAKSFYKHFTDLIVETIKLRNAPPQCVCERISGDISVMDKYYREKTNIIYLMGHRGNWELANLFSSLRFTHECIVVYRPLQNKASEQWFYELRTRFGAKLVSMDNIFKELQKPREKPYVVVLANDQSPNPKTAFWTQFLNQDTGVFRGVETIARRYDLTVLYADFKKVANKRGYYQVNISTITDKPREVPNNAILETQLRILQRDIENQPHNWLWSHRRWKHKRPEMLKPDQLPEAACDRTVSLQTDTGTNSN